MKSLVFPTDLDDQAAEVEGEKKTGRCTIEKTQTNNPTNKNWREKRLKGIRLL